MINIEVVQNLLLSISQRQRDYKADRKASLQRLPFLRNQSHTKIACNSISCRYRRPCFPRPCLKTWCYSCCYSCLEGWSSDAWNRSGREYSENYFWIDLKQSWLTYSIGGELMYHNGLPYLYFLKHLPQVLLEKRYLQTRMKQRTCYACSRSPTLWNAALLPKMLLNVWL